MSESVWSETGPLNETVHYDWGIWEEINAQISAGSGSAPPGRLRMPSRSLIQRSDILYRQNNIHFRLKAYPIVSLHG